MMRGTVGCLIVGLCATAFGPAGAQDSASIPLHQFYKTAHPDEISYNPYYYANVAIGNPGNSVNHVLVDTGSTGLYILESDLDLGSYTATSTRFDYSYSSGNRFKGYMGYGTVYFLGVKDADGHDITLGTSAPIAFGVITDSTCKDSKPDCGGLRAISAATNPNNYGWNVNQAGTMGIAYQGGQDIFNPLGQLPGTYANGFIFAANEATSSAQPVLVVGLNSDNTAGYVFTPFQSQGLTGGNIGLPAWNTKSVLTCFTAQGSTGCLQSVFDSGADKATFETEATGGPNSSYSGWVTGPVTIGVNGLLSFTSDLGSYKYENEHGSTPGYNTGNEVFLYYTVAYDYLNGRIGFRPVSVIAAGQTQFTDDSELGLPGTAVMVLGEMELGPGFVSDRAINLARSSYLDLGAPVLRINGSATLNGSLSSDGSGEVVLDGVSDQANTLTLNGVSLFDRETPITVKNLALSVNGILPGALSVAQHASLGGTGIIVGSLDVGNGAIVAPGNSIGTLTVVGDVTMRANSTLSIELGAPGVSDRLVVFGDVNFEDISLNFTKMPNTTLGIGNYTIVSATGTVTGGFGSITGPSFGSLSAEFPFLLASLSTSASSFAIDLTRSSVSYTSAALTPNEMAVATVADGLSADSPVNVALSGLDLSTAPAALNSLAGEIHASLQSSLQQQSFYLRDAALLRLRQSFAAPGEPAGTPAPAQPLLPGSQATVWGQAFGAWGDTDGDGNAAPVSRSLDGFIFGVDRPVDFGGWQTRIGLVGGYENADIDVDDVASSASVDSYDVGIYGGARLGDLGLRVGASYSWHDIATSRTVAFGNLVNGLTADYDGATTQVFGEVGYDIHLGATTLQPFVSLAYVHLDTDSFTETGGAAALLGEAETFATSYGVLGLRLNHLFTLANGRPLAVTAALGWQRAFGDLTPEATAAFAGSDAFTVAGAPIAENAALIDLGVAYKPSENFSLGLSYVGQLASSATDNAIKGSLTIRF
ncbi:autotransporter domain-containing protein [Ancylobacter sp. WKF20]|uniref:autotransporter family protein n=1 Tax=Ancylobacter sp. WKF20 TaxID=3039801 RepID=UPI002434269A|nr:autotransporter domain-containing protein [Ancylobacter sp. WKF20]WGD29826.1 autotransporter domain-containing protein [Ancylobacter sp. WKF20]